jgi:hypothetical protein
MKPRTFTSMLLLLLALPLFAFAPARPSLATIPEIKKVISSNPQAFGEFGADVAVDGDTAVVGALHEAANGLADAGVAYVFVRTGGTNWNWQATLTAADAEVGDRFGTAVAIHGNNLVVSAPGRIENGQDEAGAAYVFTRRNGVWTQTGKLVAAQPVAGDNLGTDAAIYETNVVLGTHGNSQAAFVFTRTTSGWRQQAKLVSDAADPGNFGIAVALHGNFAVIGAPLEDTSEAGDAGAAYVFSRNSDGTWRRQARLATPDTNRGFQFGYAVAIREGVAVVGAPFWFGSMEDAATAGAAYVFNRNGNSWTPSAQLLPPNLFQDQGMGHSVAIGNGYIVAGAPQVEKAYVFRNGQLHSELVPSDGQENDEFGYSVSAAGLNAVVGARSASPGGVERAGAAYLYRP